MADPRRTQKQIAERYKGNLGYYKKRHPLRVARFIVSALAIIGGIAGVVFYETRGDERFFNVGRLSQSHSSIADNCATCHEESRAVLRQISASQIVRTLDERLHGEPRVARMDAKCETCHQQHALHAPTVAENRSCAICHQEHRGISSLRVVGEKNCAACHNDPHTMQLAAAKGASVPPSQWHGRLASARELSNQRVLSLPRPAEGYTAVFESFSNGHPPFQFERERTRDPSVLRFNHQRHEAADIPLVNGKKLDCNYCHKPDVEGRYYQRVTFAANCQACHSLQFDPRNPEMTLPHGDATAVRGFLRALPTHYAELATRKGITRQSDVQAFVVRQIDELRQGVRTGEELERQVFFTTSPYKPQSASGAPSSGSFYGCAVCHELKPVANAAPAITKPVFVDRWLPGGKFNHSKHQHVACNECHRASQSRETSDVLLPPKESCVTCHSSAGKIASDCMTCHTYHAPPRQMTANGNGSSDAFKQMLLGKR